VSAGAHIELPAPAWSRGKRLLETFKRRRTIREVSEKTLPMQVLANLLWAANGVNRSPVRLIYVVDVDRLINTAGFPEPGLKDPDVQRSYYYVDTGLIAANVYLFAASTGLAAWFHNCDKTALSKKLDLRANQRVLFAQTVGYAVQEKGR
jgi:nitroreductase